MIGYILAFIVGAITGAAVTFFLMYNPKKEVLGEPIKKIKTQKKSKKANDALIKKVDRKRRK